MLPVRLTIAATGLAFCPALTGCLHDYRTATVQVRDAATGRAVPGAEVGVSYHTKVGPFAPASSTAETGLDGVATVHLAPYPAGKHIYVQVGDAYKFRDIEEGELPALPRRGLWPFGGTEARRPPDFVIDFPSPTSPAALTR